MEAPCIIDNYTPAPVTVPGDLAPFGACLFVIYVGWWLVCGNGDVCVFFRNRVFDIVAFLAWICVGLIFWGGVHSSGTFLLVFAPMRRLNAFGKLSTTHLALLD